MGCPPHFLPSSFSGEDSGLSPVSAAFIILEKPRGKKKSALGSFHISDCCSVVSAANKC